MASIAPAVRKRARELNVNLEQVTGSGQNGALKLADVEKHAGVYQEPQKTRERTEEDRPPLNHMTATQRETGDTLEIDGISFKRPDRGVLNHSYSKRLDIPQEYLNNKLQYRWVVDDGGRVDSLRERLGYETIPDIATPQGSTISTRRRTGTNSDGSPQYQQLMATPKEFFEERKRADDQALKKRMQNVAKTPSDAEGKLPEGEFYMKESHGIE